MKQMRTKHNNKGFSLVELIVVIAIMAIAVGTLTLSVSLVTGSEAKKAFRKIESLIDEARTGSMSRFDEEFTIQYCDKDSSYDGVGTVSGDKDSDGFYGKISTYKWEIETESGDEAAQKHPLVKLDGRTLISDEYRNLSKDNVSLAVVYNDGAGDQVCAIGADTTSQIKFTFDRTSGLYKTIEIKDAAGATTKIKYDKVARQFDVEGGTSNVDVFITAKSGMREYRMQLIGETGKHVEVE